MLCNLSYGKSAPEEINVVIEIAMESNPVKYEIDKDYCIPVVDRFLKVAMYYPCNYGFIPGTLSSDGDPCDVLAITPYPLVIGSLIKMRPIGALVMEDEGGKDEKIVAVPISKIDESYDKINALEDLPASLMQKIHHFFEHYKDIDKGKWVKISGWTDRKGAQELILDSIARAKSVTKS